MYNRDTFCHYSEYEKEYYLNPTVWEWVVYEMNNYRWTFWKTRTACWKDVKEHMEQNQYAQTDALAMSMLRLLKEGVAEDKKAILDCDENIDSEYYSDEIDYFALDGSRAPPTRRFPGFNPITGWYDPNRLGLADCEAIMERKRRLVAEGKLKEYIFFYEMAELAKLRKKAIDLGWK